MLLSFIKKIDKIILATYILFGGIFFHLGRQMLQIKPDGWYVGQINLYGDLVFHIGFINKFLVSSDILVSSPFYASNKPNYPIFADFVTAQISRFIGIDLALFITTFSMGILVIFVSRQIIWQIVKNNTIVFLTLLIFLLNGGFGFYYFILDFINSNEGILSFITNLPREYTDIKDLGYWWINTYLAYFLPQRGFLFAFPITITVLTLLLVGTRKKIKKYFILAGCLTGILPIVQAHSLLVLFVLASYFSISQIFLSKFNKNIIQNWLIYGLISLVIAIPLFSSLSTLSNPVKFITFDPGWTSEENLIWFWFKNLGLFLPVYIFSLFWLFRKKKLLYLYFPFFIIFIISNLFIFQPWAFDNSKLLVYWYFASSILVAYFLWDKLLSENITKKIFGFTLILFMIFAGSIDVFKTFTKSTSYKIFSAKDLQISSMVKNLTNPDAIFLTAQDHNHPIPALAGRTTLIGFNGWLWSHGLPYEERAHNADLIYRGDDAANSLIAKYQITYITIGPLEEKQFDINENFYKDFPKINLIGGWYLIDVSSIWSNSSG